MSVNEASLQLTHYMNATPWAYDMVATVPAEMLSLCHTALPRPPFEWFVQFASANNSLKQLQGHVLFVHVCVSVS